MADEERPLAAIAQEMYGDKFVGEVPEEEQPEEVVEEEAASEEPTESETEEIEGSEEEAGEVEEEEVEEIATLGELLEHYEVDPEWANGLRIPVKIDGEDGEVSLADLKASYQTLEAAQHRLDSAKSTAQTHREEMEREKQEVSRQAAVIAGLIGRMKESIDKDFSKIDWEGLRKDDPAEYGAKKADFADRHMQFDALVRELRTEYEQSSHEFAEQEKKRRADIMKAEQAKLLTVVPEWSDPSTSEAERRETAEYLVARGFAVNEIDNILDHRFFVVARDAALARRGQTKAEAAKKKITKIPKIMKPGTPKPEDQRRQDNITKLSRKVKHSGRIEDGVALLRAKRGA